MSEKKQSNSIDLSKINVEALIFHPDKNAPYVKIEKIYGLFPCGQVSMIAAEAGTGKSWFMIDCMMKGSIGLDVFGNEAKVRRSLYVAGEIPRDELNNRFLKVNGIEYDGSNITLISSYDLMLGKNEEFKGHECSLTDKGFQAVLHTVIQENKPDAIIFDSFGFFNTCEENSMKEMTEQYRWLMKLADYYKVAVILVHHLRKKSSMDKGKKREKDDVSGSSASLKYPTNLYMMESISSSSTNANANNPNKILIRHEKSNGGIKKPPFMFIMESRDENGELIKSNQEDDENTIITLEVRDANENEIVPVNKKAATQDENIKNVIKGFMLTEKRDVTTSELIAKVHETYPDVADRIIRDVLLKMSKEGEIVRCEQKQGREFVYRLPEMVVEDDKGVPRSSLRGGIDYSVEDELEEQRRLGDEAIEIMESKNWSGRYV